MGGLFGVISRDNCIQDLYFGTDYQIHLGTKRGGFAIRVSEGEKNAIHSIENARFKSKFEDDLPNLHGTMAIRVMSGYEDQRLPDLVDAIGLPEERLCTYCWDGAE